MRRWSVARRIRRPTGGSVSRWFSGCRPRWCIRCSGWWSADCPLAVHVWRRRRERLAADAAFVAELPDWSTCSACAAGAGLTVHHADRSGSRRQWGHGGVTRSARCAAACRSVNVSSTRCRNWSLDLGEPMRPLVARVGLGRARRCARCARRSNGSADDRRAMCDAGEPRKRPAACRCSCSSPWWLACCPRSRC